MKIKLGYSFTLLELLVILAIIGLLITLLLPALMNSREKARRAVCLSNLNKLYAGANLYYVNNDGDFPWVARGYPGNSERQDSSIVFQKASLRPSNNMVDFIHDNGLGTLVRQEYINIGINQCPSKGQGQFFDWRRKNMSLNKAVQIVEHGTGIINGGYGFRFNQGETWKYMKRAFERAEKPSILFWDSSSRARADNNHAQNALPNVSPYAPIISNDRFYDWAHQQGGHMVGYDGSAKWVLNFLDLSGVSKAKPRSWPAMEWGYGQVWVSNEYAPWQPTGYDTLFSR